MNGVKRGGAYYWSDEGDVYKVLVLDKGPELRWWCKVPGRDQLIALPARDLYETAKQATKA